MVYGISGVGCVWCESAARWRVRDVGEFSVKSHGEMRRLWGQHLGYIWREPQKSTAKKPRLEHSYDDYVMSSPKPVSNSTIRINYPPSLKIQNPQNQPLQLEEQMVLLITEERQAYQDHSRLSESKANVARWCARQSYAIAQPYRRPTCDMRINHAGVLLAWGWSPQFSYNIGGRNTRKAITSIVARTQAPNACSRRPRP